MFNFGRSKSKTDSSTRVWEAQSPFLRDVYQRGQNLLNQFQPDMAAYGPAMQAWQAQLNPQMNPYLNQMTQVYRDQLGQLDNQTGMNAVGGGVYGGGRQGVEQFLNQRNVGNQMGQFLGSQYQADMNRANQALGMAPMMMGMNPYNQQQSALQGYASLIGDPTILSRSKGRSRSSSFGLSDFGGASLLSGLGVPVPF